MERFLVAYEDPVIDVLEGDPITQRQMAWDRWIDALTRRGLSLPCDLDPVATIGGIEVYEATHVVAPRPIEAATAHVTGALR